MNIFQLEQAPSSPHNPKMDKLLRKQIGLITLPLLLLLSVFFVIAKVS